MAAVDDRLRKYAELAVRVGANVEEGQTVFINSMVEHAPLARALTRASYDAGARYVDVGYRDQHVRKAMIELGPDEALTHTPDWLKTRMDVVPKAMIWTTGDPEPELLSELDGERVGKAQMKELAEIARKQMVDRSVNWSGVAYPTDGWAQKVFGEPDVERLWEAVSFCTRLDEPDPVAAWREHMARLEARATKLTELRFDALHYRGPGTDFTVGLLPAARWMSALFRRADGREYVPNMPTEEIFTSPDCRRAEGTIRSSLPLALLGDIVEDLQLTVKDGKIVDVQAKHGAELVRGQLESDERAGYFGELALVDGTSRVGQTGITFFDTLYDENATCHIAYGFGIPDVLEGEPGDGLNVSTVHTDFMVGRPELEIDGLTKDGQAIPILREETWQLPD
ncbi:MAG: aminopeptidase [Gaiellaceae bacterium]